MWVLFWFLMLTLTHQTFVKLQNGFLRLTLPFFPVIQAIKITYQQQHYQHHQQHQLHQLHRGLTSQKPNGKVTNSIPLIIAIIGIFGHPSLNQFSHSQCKP